MHQVVGKEPPLSYIGGHPIKDLILVGDLPSTMQLSARRSSSYLSRASTFSPQLRRRRQRPFAIQSLSFSMASSLPRLPIFEALAGHDPRSTVVVHSASGRKFTYGELLSDVADERERLLMEAGSRIDGERIAFLVENSYDYVGAQKSLPRYNCWDYI